MSQITCARVGYGTVARLHEQKLSESGVKTVAVIDTDSQKKQQAEQAGFLVLPSCAEAAPLRPGFWDICVNTSQHFNVIQQILQVDPQANILVEKPVCLLAEIPSLTTTIVNFGGKIVVNENYASSKITGIVQEIAFRKLGLRPSKIVVEFTKNRQLDSIGGRFIDYDLGVLGYEGPHMLAIVAQLGEELQIDQIIDSRIIEPSTPLHCQGETCARNQGSAFVRCRSKTGVEVELYTCMAGIVQYRYPLFSIENIPIEDTLTRYRLVALTGTDPAGDEYTIVGFFEPLPNFHRSQGAVITLKNQVIVGVLAPVEDDCMGVHLQRAVDYFTGTGENPYSLAMALHNTILLHRLAGRATLLSPLCQDGAEPVDVETKSLLWT
ncbi:hypothetical protein BST81_13035 [Leptolyngbya sp. 'hensonii']|uniref:Gfo/Idh/MocA family oxidoreductase n=1 Tax=Leptolyngbya sp. 'hensonii' TaxID=1922337 RepID=UPI00094FEE40|nr:Gfo/Idh/MocA family oxidoreductase [Leptolyngbya sp. 'hensonii']OLP17969.1 hypothetical protein BST81_13035 [Leptolyngbya sp. 'hensonii']